MKTAPTNAATAEVQAAFLIALAEAGIEPDMQELLVQGNPARGIPPGALAKALRAVSALSSTDGLTREDGWREIASAPKDGTPFLVWAPGYDWPEVIRWYEYDAEGVEETGELGYFQYAEEALAERFDWEHEVTYWRPLPSSPAEVG